VPAAIPVGKVRGPRPKPFTVAEVPRSPGATRSGQPIPVSGAGALARMRDPRAKPPPHGNVKASKTVPLEASNYKA
jgi:hypothetical protein